MIRRRFYLPTLCAGVLALIVFVAGVISAEPEEKPSGTPKAATRAPKREYNRANLPIDAAKFGEGWRVTVPLTALKGESYEVWVQNGWLIAKRLTDKGELDWQIVLARVVPNELPMITTMDGVPLFELSYLGGRYFIRDTSYALRALRERKTDGGMLPRSDFLPDKAKAGGWGKSVDGPPIRVLTLSSWWLDGWFFVASGTDQEHFDAVVRLDPETPGRGGHGVQTMVGGFARMFHGDAHLIDDGELLVALPRTLVAHHEAQLALEELRAKIRGGVAPAIEATSWLNTEGALDWDKLKGKVVVLDFWGTWCGPCVKKLPEVQAFADKYAGSDLVVIGVHSSQDAETCADFVKEHKLTYPIAIDSGKTAESFGVASWPTVFLVDKTGKVTMGYTSKLPPDAVIEAMLND
jgi:thiol-disulfide isomerase/thioredoxin